MIVCSCNALREAQLRDIARTGVCCERDAYRQLGCTVSCGRCIPFARQVVHSENMVRSKSR